jgi:hypothetical protein
MTFPNLGKEKQPSSEVRKKTMERPKMPHRSRQARREWERSPAQRVAAAERQARHRDSRHGVESLAALQKIIDRVGHDSFLGEGLREEVRRHEPRIRAHLARVERQQVEVWVDGRRVDGPLHFTENNGPGNPEGVA